MNCPLDKKDCQGCEYQKENLCNYLYEVGTLEEISEVTEDVKSKD